MGSCCSKNQPKQASKSLLKATNSVQPTLQEYEYSDQFSVKSKDIDEIDERWPEIPTYRPRKTTVKPRRPASVPTLPLETVDHVPTPIDEEAVAARRFVWASVRQKPFRELPISTKQEVSHDLIDKNSPTPRDYSSKASISPDAKPPLPPKRAILNRKSYDFSAAVDRYKSRDLLSPQSISVTKNGTPKNINTVASAVTFKESPKTRDLLTLARQKNRMKTEVTPSSGKSAFSHSSGKSFSHSSGAFMNEGSPYSASYSPKTADIMNSDVGSFDGELPQLFSASFYKFPNISTCTRTCEQPSSMDKSIMKLKKSELVEKKKLDDNTLKINQYILEKQIGKGGFGVVFSAIDTESGFQRAIKVFNKKLLAKKSFGKKSNPLNGLRREIEIQSSVSHPNIIQVFEVIEDLNSNKVYLILELAELGSIAELSPMPLNDAWIYFKQLISALYYIHEQANIVHRDIKPQNLLINSEYVLKLSDFGTAQSIVNGNGDEFSNLAGTHAFMAPEMLGSARPFAGKPLDMWAAGISLYYFINGCTPFKSRKIPQLYTQIQSQEIVIANTLEPDLVDLMKGLLCRDPAKRFTVKETMAHPWLAK